MEKNKGFSAFEILFVVVLYALIFSTIALLGFKSVNNSKYKSLKYDAIAFLYNSRTYLTYNNLTLDNNVYLKEIVDFDSSYNIVNPFNDKEYCSLLESYISKKNSNLITIFR